MYRVHREGERITSILITKKLATHYFEIVDNYVDDIVNKTKEFIETIKD